MFPARSLYDKDNIHQLIKTEVVERKGTAFALLFKKYILTVMASLEELENWIRTRTGVVISTNKQKMLAYIGVNLKALEKCKGQNLGLKPESISRIQVEEERWKRLAALIKEATPSSAEAEIKDFKKASLSYLERLKEALMSASGDIDFFLRRKS